MKALNVRNLLAFGIATLVVAGCERPSPDTIQRGYRGTAMGLVYNPRTVAALQAANAVPDPQPAVDAGGPPATAVYQNVQVLTDLNAAQLARLMVAMTQWVAPPDQACNYCHAPDNMASDTNYRKVVARQMLRMVRDINSGWKSHVAATGVTCYTCHRGNGVPQYTWYRDMGSPNASEMAGNRAGQNAPAPQVGLTSLPNDPFDTYLAKNAQSIRVEATGALPHNAGTGDIKSAEQTYGLMIHMTKALGVNCTFCHNSRQFAAWDQSTPQRATAWHGISMVRELNNHYLEGLTGVFPANRKGPGGDVAKVDCETCHQGVYKPLFGKSMLKDYPELSGAAAAPAPTTAPATAATAAPAAPAGTP
jgi:photosynthetic reaction center cytochrome c subunit